MKFCFLKLKLRNLKARRNRQPRCSPPIKRSRSRLERSKSPIFDSIVKSNRNINRANKTLLNLLENKVYKPVLAELRHHSQAIHTRQMLVDTLNTISEHENDIYDVKVLPESVQNLSPLKHSLGLKKKPKNQFKAYLEDNIGSMSSLGNISLTNRSKTTARSYITKKDSDRGLFSVTQLGAGEEEYDGVLLEGEEIYSEIKHKGVILGFSKLQSLFSDTKQRHIE